MKQKIHVEQYSAKLDDIHLVLHGEGFDICRTLCGKPMLAFNTLATAEYRGYTAEDRNDLLKCYPRIVCERCLAELANKITRIKEVESWEVTQSNTLTTP
jgi:hypothetical protein